jgi:hypothetical protein
MNARYDLIAELERTGAQLEPSEKVLLGGLPEPEARRIFDRYTRGYAREHARLEAASRRRDTLAAVHRIAAWMGRSWVYLVCCVGLPLVALALGNLPNPPSIVFYGAFNYVLAIHVIALLETPSTGYRHRRDLALLWNGAPWCTFWLAFAVAGLNWLALVGR